MTTTILATLAIADETRRWLGDEGLFDDSILREAVAADIAGLPKGEQIKLRRGFPNLSPAVASPAPAGGIKAAVRDRAVTAGEIIDRLAANDFSIEVVEMAAEVGLTEVVIDSAGRVNAEASKSFRAHRGPRPALWRDMAIVRLDEYLRLQSVKISPTTGRALVEGSDEATGVPWATLGVRTAARVLWAAEDGLLRGHTDEAVYRDFLNAGSLSERCEKRRLAQGVDLAPYIHAVAGLDRRAAAEPSSVTTTSPHTALYQLLLGAFSADELRRFLRMHFGAPFEAGLPGATVSHAKLVSDACDRLRSHGYITRELFRDIRQERPRKAADINLVARICGCE